MALFIDGPCIFINESDRAEITEDYLVANESLCGSDGHDITAIDVWHQVLAPDTIVTGVGCQSPVSSRYRVSPTKLDFNNHLNIQDSVRRLSG